jgi:hypothetical protein
LRYWVTHGEERIKVVQDEPKLLVAWIPGTLTPNEEIEEFRRKLA